MTSVRVSSRYQIVIPQEIRAALGIRRGMRVHVTQYGTRVVIFAARSTRKVRGFLRGIDTMVPRDKDRV
jgi:AbrB family looped-hinge helix DNA binding protein